jgi:hypothetical protein
MVHLGNVECVEYEDMVVVLGEGDHVPLTGDLQSAAAGHLHKPFYSTQCCGSELIFFGFGSTNYFFRIWIRIRIRILRLIF